jgi:hypothetical protein
MFRSDENKRWFRTAAAIVVCLAMGSIAWASWPEEDDLKASLGSPQDAFGYAVSIDGDHAVIGAPTTPWEDGPGCAYVFGRVGTTWSQLARLTVAGGSNGDDFGAAVAISEDVVVVGAPTTYAVGGAGAAYVFVKPSSGWSNTSNPTATLSGSDTVAPDHFGCAVAIDGEVIVVGAWGDRFGGAGAGAAYIFEKPSSGWDSTNQEDAKLTASDRAAGDCLGFSVAISGDVILLGNYCDGDYDSGNAYVYVEPSTGWTSMTETAQLNACSASWDQFAWSVSISGDYALVGVPGYDGVSQRDGCAYIFQKPSDGWSGTIVTPTAKLTASDAAYNDFLGHSVAIDGDYAVVGAREDSGQTGSAYLFEKPTSGWANTTETQKVVGSDSHPDRDEFGCSVAISGRDAIVGAHYWEQDPNDPNNQNYGAAYVFHRTSSRCPGDLNDDSVIDLFDLAQLLANYGVAEDAIYEQGDIDEDGDVDLGDLAELLRVYGTTCPEEGEPDLLTIRILSDGYASETTWELWEQGGEMIAAGAPEENHTLYEWEVSVEPDGCYDFTIYDSWGDGICCAYGEGYYEIELNGELVAANYNFHGYEETVSVGGGCVELNDDCEDAAPIGEVQDLPFDTTEATFDGEGQCMFSPNIWYRFTAPVDGTVYVATCGSQYDTKLAVYDGGSCDPPPPMIGCNDDSCGLQSEIRFPAIAGQEYLIEVGGYSNLTGPGVLTVFCE